MKRHLSAVSVLLNRCVRSKVARQGFIKYLVRHTAVLLLQTQNVTTVIAHHMKAGPNNSQVKRVNYSYVRECAAVPLPCIMY